MFVALMIYVSLLFVPAHPTTYLDSPVPYSAEAIAAGSSVYMENCSGCHGADGRGNANPADPAAHAQLDLNQITPARRAGDLFWSIAHGIQASSMPGFGAQLGEGDIWSLVQFLDAQTAAQNALTLSDRLQSVKPVPAPEFNFEFPYKLPASPQESLRQQRGKRIPLLVLYTLPASLPRLRELAALESDYARAGAVVIAIPMNASPIASLAGTSGDLPAGAGSILAFTSPAVAATYAMFAAEEDDKSAAAVQHVEYLVDRFGSIRARGIGVPEARSKWSVRMLHQIGVLVNEPPRPPIRWGHRH
jgi:mono/diheme cytochrome c family protein